MNSNVNNSINTKWNSGRKMEYEKIEDSSSSEIIM